MFTGIIEEIGTIKNIKQSGSNIQIEISAKKILADLEVDHSVAVNGVCLTAVEVKQDSFVVDAVLETLKKSTTINLQKNDKVNLERALRLSDRLGGHFVQGHVDAIGLIKKFTITKDGGILMIEIPASLHPYTISKGSIAIDGISLTIAEKKEDVLTLSVIPHTIKQTALQNRKVGDKINIETDFLAKYIEQFINIPNKENKLSIEWIKQQGF